MDNFKIRQTNPNEEFGGGGCLCSNETKDRDCKGPFVVFDTAEMIAEDNPYPVACQTCIAHALRDMDDKGTWVDYKAAKDDAPEKKEPVKTKSEVLEL